MARLADAVSERLLSGNGCGNLRLACVLSEVSGGSRVPRRQLDTRSAVGVGCVPRGQFCLGSGELASLCGGEDGLEGWRAWRH